MNKIDYKERSIDFYRNILRDFFDLSEDMEFMAGTPENDRRRGIDIAIQHMHLTPEEEQIIILRYEKKCSNKDIAASVLVSERKVASTLKLFSTQIKLSPYRMYIKCGDLKGDQYSYYVKGLFDNKKNEMNLATYTDFGEQIGWLDITVFGLFGISNKLIRSMLEAGWFQIESVIAAVKGNTANWKEIQSKNKKDASVLINVLSEYRLIQQGE